MPIDYCPERAYARPSAFAPQDGRNLFSYMALWMETAPANPNLRLLNAPFAVALILLTTAAILAGPVSRWLDFKQKKDPILLRNPLSTLIPETLEPYRITRRLLLEAAVLEALGTNDYINWRLEDTSVPASDPLRNVTLFVTYDTGGRNLVPHTPDECFLGAGYEQAQPHENTDVFLPSLGPHNSSIPVRVCTFARTAIFNHQPVTVIYTFGCNGQFAASRTAVRFLINDPRNSYAYFSKVEVQFPGASREASIEGARKLFDRVLPVLIRDHWPDFEAAERSAKSNASAQP